MEQYLEWKSGMPAKPMLQAIFGVTDPRIQIPTGMEWLMGMSTGSLNGILRRTNGR